MSETKTPYEKNKVHLENNRKKNKANGFKRFEIAKMDTDTRNDLKAYCKKHGVDYLGAIQKMLSECKQTKKRKSP